MQLHLVESGRVTLPGTNQPEGSQALRSHRSILAAALKQMGMNHKQIAKAMGWKSPATAGHKLRGRNDWAPGELEKMCKLAGMTIVSLAAQSDDLTVTKRPEAVEGAVILDDLPEDQLAAIMAILRSYRAAQAR
jgi:hypothetical protein